MPTVGRSFLPLLDQLPSGKEENDDNDDANNAYRDAYEGKQRY